MSIKQVESVTDTRKDTTSSVGVIIHALAVVPLATFFTLAVATTDQADANIGGGMAWMVLGLLGLPWSIAYFPLGLDGAAGDALVLGAAAVNVGLHYAWYRSKR